MILFIHLTSETCLIFQKAVSTFFFCKMSWDERSPSVSHPRHSRWQGWIGREGWAARHLRNPHGDVIESCRTKKQKTTQRTDACRTQRHTLDTLIHHAHVKNISCRLVDTYPNISKKHACKLATLENFGHGRKCHLRNLFDVKCGPC